MTTSTIVSSKVLPCWRWLDRWLQFCAYRFCDDVICKQNNWLREVSESIDKRTSGYKRRSEAIKKKTDVAVQMIRNAINQGIQADYVLMDTGFTHEPMICSILDEGLDVIGMVKQLKQRYHYKEGFYTLPELRKLLPEHTLGNQFGSIIVKTKNGIPVKLGTEFHGRSYDIMISLHDHCFYPLHSAGMASPKRK